MTCTCTEGSLEGAEVEEEEADADADAEAEASTAAEPVAGVSSEEEGEREACPNS
jgi:hypothetical protein